MSGGRAFERLLGDAFEIGGNFEWATGLGCYFLNGDIFKQFNELKSCSIW